MEKDIYMPVNINVKTKITINEKEYSSLDELPPKLRKVYDQALANQADSPQMQINGSSKVTFNGKTYNNRDAIPVDARSILDSTMAAIDRIHDGIPDSLQTSENAVLLPPGTPTPISPLPAQPSPISPDRPTQGRTIITLVAILVVLLVVALLYFGSIR